jgi:hypothetical protein
LTTGRHMRRLSAEALVSGALLVVGAIAVNASLELYRQGTSPASGPGVFPLVISISLTVLALWNTVTSVQEARRSASGEEVPGIPLGAWPVVATSAGAIALLGHLGFVATMLVAMCLLLVIFGERRWRIVVPVAVGSVLVTFVLFREVFGVRLPVGVLSFLG